MRLGEIITAGVLALFSIFLMVESANCRSATEQGEGPGGGAWPFWLSAIMLITTGFIAWNWYENLAEPSQSERAGSGWLWLEDAVASWWRAFGVHRPDRHHLDVWSDGGVLILLRQGFLANIHGC